MNFNREIKHVLSLIDPDLLGLLEDNRCIIAGGALTSVFTNKEINDIDVYFRDSKSFSHVVRHILTSDSKSEYDGIAGIANARVTHYTNKSILLNSNGQKVQLIAYRFFPTVDDIYADFDFIINMAAIELNEGGIEKSMFTCHQDFLKHCSQRYIQFHEGTRYPLVSALRVQKYVERGYSISKAQMIKLLLAINAKNIDSWEVLLDEIGSMYGLKPDELFDTTQAFSLESAMAQLDKIESIPQFMYKNQIFDWETIYKEFEGKWDEDTTEWMGSPKKDQEHRWLSPYREEFSVFLKKKQDNQAKEVYNSFFGVAQKEAFAFPSFSCYPSATPVTFIDDL